jgi:hypothetical protein
MKAFSRYLILGVVACLLALAVGLCPRASGKRRYHSPLAGMRVRRGRPRSSDNRPACPTSPCRRIFLPPEEEDDSSEARLARAAAPIEPHEIAGGLTRSRFVEPASGTSNLTTPLYLRLHILVI